MRDFKIMSKLLADTDEVGNVINPSPWTIFYGPAANDLSEELLDVSVSIGNGDDNRVYRIPTAYDIENIASRAVANTIARGRVIMEGNFGANTGPLLGKPFMASGVKYPEWGGDTNMVVNANGWAATPEGVRGKLYYHDYDSWFISERPIKVMVSFITGADKGTKDSPMISVSIGEDYKVISTVYAKVLGGDDCVVSVKQAVSLPPSFAYGEEVVKSMGLATTDWGGGDLAIFVYPTAGVCRMLSREHVIDPEAEALTMCVSNDLVALNTVDMTELSISTAPGVRIMSITATTL